MTQHSYNRHRLATGCIVLLPQATRRGQRPRPQPEAAYLSVAAGVDRGSPEQPTGIEEPPSCRPALILRQYQDTPLAIALAGFVLTLLLSSCGPRQETGESVASGTSWSSILDQSIDPSTMANPVQEWEQSRHFSSSAATNKVMLAPLAPEITGDMDHGFFLKVEEHPGGVDATLAEAQGPGMISWIWSANPVGTIRLFIDDDTSPALEMPFQKFLEGDFLPYPGPFATLTALGYNLHFPLLHEKSCRLVLRVREKKGLASLYYQVAWNAVDPSQPIQRFSRSDISLAKLRLKALAEALDRTMAGPSAEPLLTKDIPAGAVVELYASDQAGTLTCIVLQADTKTELASLDLLAYWDGEESPSLDCPLPLLAGVSEAMEEVRSLPVTLRGSQLILRWPMPHQSARLAVRNRGVTPVRLRYAVLSGPPAGISA